MESLLGDQLGLMLKWNVVVKANILDKGGARESKEFSQTGLVKLAEQICNMQHCLPLYD